MILRLKAAFVFTILLLFTELHSFSQSVDHWETIVKTGDDCKYHIPNSDIGTSWKNKDFSDGSWITAKSGVGFGDNDDNTTISRGINSVYIRYSFNIKDVSQISSLVLDVDYDDGFIAYLNGTEVVRDNVNNPVRWNMELNSLHEASMYKGGRPERFEISKFKDELLKNGENVLAVEVHNESASSSDLSSNVFLHVGVSSTEKVYANTPDWFWEPIDFANFNLPLVIIETNNQTIPEDQRIVADMGIINNGEGQTNAETDDWNEYSGKISIERRGESSNGFKKKSYSLELQNEDGSNNNVSILGLPEENDFVLYGPYSDKTLIKNVLSYELFRRTGRWAPGTRYVEVILNGDYNGVYVLTEKLKRDENRVDIDKLTEEDISPVDISGGYILRRDKTAKSDDEEWWTSPVAQPYHERMWYEYFDPKYKDLTQDQADYIKDWMEEFDNVMSGEDFNAPEIGYKKYIKTKSFIDMMFLNEISKGIDNYLFSTYFYKENDADGGQLVAGPPWDYNLGYGNLNYGDDWDAAETYGWCFPQGSR
ncbi:MAG TPA: CotH kinase family protein, partial [Draconibacterium sp.]|nr:CotH kinase family protein [Draconibacterium sp.]